MKVGGGDDAGWVLVGVEVGIVSGVQVVLFLRRVLEREEWLGGNIITDLTLNISTNVTNVSLSVSGGC